MPASRHDGGSRRKRGRWYFHVLYPAVIVATLCFALAMLYPVLRHPLLLVALYRQPPPAHLPVPVQGVDLERIADAWGAPRAGGRKHQGVDIFAPKGRPVLANVRGIVLKLGTGGLGGNSVEVLGPGLECHYYAHLSRFGSYRVGDPVRLGDVLGYVGDTGNAQGTPYHLHYAIYQWRSRALNPYPRLHIRDE